MATSADIGANFENYTGNAQLGGAGLGVFDIDTKPLQQLASYTFFYNKTRWEQKQRETDANVAKLADLSNIAVNDLRGKDREQAVKEFADLQQYASEYARKDPKTPQERMQNELEWQTKYGAFKNNFGSGKARAVTYYKRRNEILTNITDATTQDEAIRQLDKQFDDTDITTPISAVPNFKIEKFDIPEPVQQKFTSIAIMGNDNLKMKNGIYNPKLNGGVADAALLSIGKAYPQKGTPEYDNLSPNEKAQADLQATVPSDGRGLVDMARFLNKAIEPYVKGDKFDADAFETDNASNTVLMNAYNAAKVFNEKMHDSYNQALNGYFTNKGVNIPLPPNIVANDFKYGFVDFVKGVSPNNLMQSGMFAKYTGDTFDADIQHTGEANDLKKANIAASTQRRGQDLDFEGKQLDLIGKGWTRDKKGKLQPPKNSSLTSSANGGIVPYWQNYITPQINAGVKKISNALGMSENDLKNFSGDVDINANDVSGLGIALVGEIGTGGHQKGIIGADVTTKDAQGNEKTIKRSEIKIRFESGSPIGVVIDGIFYDQNDINSKATRLQDKTVSNKQDAPIFGTTEQPETQLTDAQKFLQGLK